MPASNGLSETPGDAAAPSPDTARDADPPPADGAPAGAPPRRRWPKERIQKLLANGAFSYQRIDLPFGLATQGEDRRPTADLIFPESLAGKTVVDLGCNHGYFCFEALRRGAQQAVGYDHSAAIVRRAGKLAEIKEMPASFAVRDLDNEPLREAFDYVLCLNALHHFANPLQQLEAMMEMTRDTLVLEMAGFGLFDCFRALEVSPLFALLAFLVSPFPVMFVGLVQESRPGVPRKLKFYFTRRALRRLFERNADRFPGLKFIRSPFKSRYLLIARRKA